MRRAYLGHFIRDYLIEKGEAYVYEIYRAYRDWCRKNKIHGISYEGMRAYIYALKKLGLIELSRIEGGVGKLAHRHYYRVVKDRIYDEMWNNIMKAYRERKGSEF